ncbi:hypothetical protein [Marinisporobacter balticus]|uniref:Uncharacterized protein n=1 Tax=Marinisporobacter balticus TaxID=2018667 RepID=A0A4R2KM47_9FIRM|nr:hypothetical protein [Marinisporobacter balticus]TCO74763.1 hypothetical protein EV214_11125 [Marinisporobacter balticus]
MSKENIKELTESDRTKLYFLAKKLEDIAKEIGGISEEEKQFVIERVYGKNSKAIVKLCNTIIDHLGW